MATTLDNILGNCSITSGSEWGGALSQTVFDAAHVSILHDLLITLTVYMCCQNFLAFTMDVTMYSTCRQSTCTVCYSISRQCTVINGVSENVGVSILNPLIQLYVCSALGQELHRKVFATASEELKQDAQFDGKKKRDTPSSLNFSKTSFFSILYQPKNNICTTFL